MLSFAARTRTTERPDGGAYEEYQPLGLTAWWAGSSVTVSQLLCVLFGCAGGVAGSGCGANVSPPIASIELSAPSEADVARASGAFRLQRAGEPAARVWRVAVPSEAGPACLAEAMDWCVDTAILSAGPKTRPAASVSYCLVDGVVECGPVSAQSEQSVGECLERTSFRTDTQQLAAQVTCGDARAESRVHVRPPAGELGFALALARRVSTSCAYGRLRDSRQASGTVSAARRLRLAHGLNSMLADFGRMSARLDTEELEPFGGEAIDRLLARQQEFAAAWGVGACDTVLERDQ